MGEFCIKSRGVLREQEVSLVHGDGRKEVDEEGYEVENGERGREGDREAG